MPHVNSEFVLDANGKPLTDETNLEKYADCFSIKDIFQGYLNLFLNN